MSLSKNFPTTNPSLVLDFINNQRLDPRITFVRATPATYYDGVTQALAEQNLLLQSQSLAAGSWSALGVTLSDNVTTAPDGTSTASRITEAATTGEHYTAQTLSTFDGGVFTYSVYLRKGSLATAPDWVQLACGGTNSGYFTVNLATGAAGNTSGFASTVITNIGSGWYRVSVTATVGTSAISFWVGFTNNTNAASRAPSYTGVTTSDVFAWGAQVEKRSSPAAYTATTTQSITNYIPVLLTAAAGVARFDSNPVSGQSLGLLIEQARTNILTYSADFANASWTKDGATIGSNSIIAPDGTLTGDKLIATTAVNVRHIVFKIQSTVASSTNTFSCYAKAGEYQFLALSLIQGSNSSGMLFIFNLTDGTFAQNGAIGGYTGVVATSTSVGNGWYRCAITFTNAGATADYFIIAPSPSATPSTEPFYRTPAYTGNGFSGIYIWGAQLEQGNPNTTFPTSYIATTATVAARNYDDAKLTGTNFSSWWNRNEGSAFIEYQFYGQALNGGALWTQTAGDQRLLWSPSQPFIRGSGTNTQSAFIVPVNTVARAASAYSAITNETAQSTNGATTVVRTDYNGQISRDYTNVSILDSGAGGNVSLGWVRRLMYYPERLTDTQLQNLTKF